MNNSTAQNVQLPNEIAHNVAAPLKANRRVRVYENVSCITVDEESVEYDLKGMSYFDVPLETWSEGCQRGTVIVYELLKMGAQDDRFDCLREVLEECAKELVNDTSGPDIESKRGAAVGVFSTLQQVFNFAASRLDFTELFEHDFKCIEAEFVEQLDSMRQQHASILADLKKMPSQVAISGV